MTDVSLDLATFVADGVVDAGSRERAVALLGATASSACDGAGSADVSALIAAVDPCTDGGATPLGHATRMAVPAAAMVTGTAAAQTTTTSEQRALAAVVAAAVATAEARQVAGAELVDSIVIGAEVALRFGDGLAASTYAAQGWDPVVAAGSLGATAAVARLVGIGTETIRQAFGVAATQAGGLAVAEGTTTWALHVGKAAANGAESALLCAEGFSGPRKGLEGRRGLFEVAAPGTDRSVIVADLGERWRLLEFPPHELYEPAGTRSDLSDLVALLTRSETPVQALVASCHDARTAAS